MSARQKARAVKAAQQTPQIVQYADGLIALGNALKNPQSSIREIARLSNAVGLRLEFCISPKGPSPSGSPASAREMGEGV
jgi:hypothetical protein